MSDTEGNDRLLGIEDLAAAWISIHWAEANVGILGREEIRQIRRQARVLSDGLGIVPRAVAVAARRSRCPAATPTLATLAGGFGRFGDAFPAYSMAAPEEATTRRFLPRIQEAERALTVLYWDWLTIILRDLFPEATGRSMTAAAVLARAGGEGLALDIVRRCRAAS